MDTFKLVVEKRETSGKGPARRLRMEGKIPAVVYGKGLETVPLTVGLIDVHAALRHGQNVVLELQFAGGKRKKRYAVVKEMQHSAAKHALLHVDLHEIDLKEEIEAAVAVELLGTARGIADGGVLDHQHHEVHVRALPTVVPTGLQIDVSGLGIGDHVTVADLATLDGVTFIDDPGLVIAAVLAPRVVEEAEEAEAAETVVAPTGETGEE